MNEQSSQLTTPLEKKVWKPVEQATIPFYAHELVAVRLEDGRIAAVLRWLFEGMGLSIKSQMRHIQGRRALTKGLITVEIKTSEGGVQEMAALTLDVLSGWLITVDERRVRAEAYDDVVRFQEEAVQVLADHFAQKHVASLALPAPTAVVEATQVAPQRPIAPGSDASVEEWMTYHEAMITFLRWQQDIETWRASTDARIEVVEGQVGEIARIVPEIIEKLGSQPLSPAHQSAIQRGVNLLHDLLGKPHARIYNELRQDFHVGKYDQIPDTRWPAVVAWFRKGIQDAERQTGMTGKENPFAEDHAEQGRLF